MPYKIGLDRGHGAADPGAVKFVKEVDVNTILVKQLEDMLKADPDYTPVLTCPYDKGTTIAQRADKANAENVDLLISNHFNAGGGDGWEIYPEVPRVKGHARYNLYSSSLSFAKILAPLTGDIQQLRGSGGIQYKYAGMDAYFGIIRLSNSPTVLVENAFVDNLKDISDFDTEPEILRLAGRQYHAVCQHFGTKPIFTKDGARIGAPQPPEPTPQEPDYRYRVYVEKAVFNNAQEALALSRKENGIVMIR